MQNGGVIYGYARVPADRQSLAAQVAALQAAGASKVFRETAGGVRADGRSYGARWRRLNPATC